MSVRRVGKAMNTPISTVFLVFGLFFALSYAESRKRIFRCDGCGLRVKRHTVLSKVFLGVFLLQIMSIVVIAALEVVLLFFLRF